ncbi:hypothetical protein AG4045_013566 [Apium graveolens]|uniref:non-specific serine/threonine protein kinase n=1 Tax=Apium graveolens TaxID=4045 RepID=A0A6L5BBI7_APIGR|nr:hypothetical protein AG4045_013566 [Apium graveolens]
MAASMIAFSQLNSKLTMVLASNAARRVQTALHLLSLVLESGRPNRLRELLLRCKFLRFTLHLIGSLCSLPRTVFLRPDPVISITMSAFVAFTQALWNLWSGVAFVPRSLRYHQRKNPLANVTKVYTRKRKRNATGILVLAGGDMGAIGGNCPPTIVVDTPAQTVSPKKLKQDDVQKGRSTGESYKSDGKPISTSHKVLKKEITLYQLQWYGYCLFRALSSLHKQGVIHRDVKPENFLFSRMANKGYLIDFNLARDMNKIYGTTGKPKTKEEGPCVGTKGFKAPEVLLKSYFQGPVIDVWSAGVTLVYLTSGRSPFVGDPDQNLMGIAELRGSEDLWEVARLHDRESSFPMVVARCLQLAN